MTPTPDEQGVEYSSYAGVATAEDEQVVAEFGEFAEALEDDEGEETEHGVLMVAGEIKCVLPPMRSSSVDAGAVLSTDSDLFSASWACLRNFWTTSYKGVEQRLNFSIVITRSIRLTRLFAAVCALSPICSNSSHRRSSSCSDAGASEEVGARVTNRHITIYACMRQCDIKHENVGDLQQQKEIATKANLVFLPLAALSYASL